MLSFAIKQHQDDKIGAVFFIFDPCHSVFVGSRPDEGCETLHCATLLTIVATAKQTVVMNYVIQDEFKLSVSLRKKNKSILFCFT